MEVVAEESLRALDAASFSISRWQRDREVLQTLINVGELGPGEGAGRRPRSLPAGRLPDRDRPPAPRGALRVRDRRSPQTPSGWPYCAGSAGERDRGAGDLRVRDLGRAVGHRQRRPAVRGRGDCSRRSPSRWRRRSGVPSSSGASRFATRTRLRIWPTGACSTSGWPEPAPSLTLLACDVDGLKEVNEGHPAGDALLRGVAGALSLTASAFPQSLVARGRRRRVLVCCCRAHSWRRPSAARAASRHIAAELGERVSVCWGPRAARPPAARPAI